MPATATSLTRSTLEAINTLSPGDRRVLNENELAQRWGISPKTLQRWRCEGRGPKYLKLSKRVSYALEMILDFEKNALHVSTSERSSALELTFKIWQLACTTPTGISAEIRSRSERCNFVFSK